MDALRDAILRFLLAWMGAAEEVWLFVGAVAMTMFVTSWALRGTSFWHIPLTAGLLLSFFQPGMYWAVPALARAVDVEIATPSIRHIWAFGGSALVALATLLIVSRYVGTAWDRAKSLLTRRTALQRDERTDIRSIASLLPEPRSTYQPEKYFKNERGLFLGLDEHRRPIYISWSEWRRKHIDIVGTTGSGKGVAAQIMTAQCARSGEAVVVIDPKNDEFLVHVLHRAAAEAKIPFLFVDLAGDIAQWHLFGGKTKVEIEELLTAGFSLGERGTDADFYRLDDRRAARLFAGLDGVERQPLAASFTRLLTQNPDLSEKAKKFVADLEEVAQAPVVATDAGLDFKATIEVGGVIYARGSMRNPRILKLQRMFLISIMQMIENRPRTKARHVCLFLDEFKYLISRPALELLGAIRDKKAHAILAHQSLGDLRDCPADLDPESVVASVNENTAIKIAYAVRDPDTADWLARMSGQILVDDEIKQVRTNIGLAEMRENGRALRQAERPLIDTNMLQSLPDRCAVLYGVGLARFFFTSPIHVRQGADAPTPTIPRMPSGEGVHGLAPFVEHKLPGTIAAGVIDVD